MTHGWCQLNGTAPWQDLSRKVEGGAVNKAGVGEGWQMSTPCLFYVPSSYGKRIEQSLATSWEMSHRMWRHPQLQAWARLQAQKLEGEITDLFYLTLSSFSVEVPLLWTIKWFLVFAVFPRRKIKPLWRKWEENKGKGNLASLRAQGESQLGFCCSLCKGCGISQDGRALGHCAGLCVL